MKYLSVVILLCGLAVAQFQNAELVAPDGAAMDQLGWSISLSGRTLAMINTYASARGGIVYVYQEPVQGGWGKSVMAAKLRASDGIAFDSVSVSGSVIVAGAATETTQGTKNAGAVYLFAMPTSGWQDATETAVLTPSDPSEDGYFGYSVAVNNKTIVVGAVGSGEAYVFSEPDQGWLSGSETAKLLGSDVVPGADFGLSVAINGPKALVGCPNAYGIGAVYVYREQVGGWQTKTQDAELTDAKAKSQEQLGYSVAILGDTVAAGEPFTGKVMVYVQQGTVWRSTGTPTAVLTSTERAPNLFGTSVAINSGMIVVGDPGAAGGGWKQHAGAGFVYKKPQGGWVDATQDLEIKTHVGGALVGWSIALENNKTVIMGAPSTPVNGNQEQGAGYVITVK